MRECLNAPLVGGLGGVGLSRLVWLVVEWQMTRDHRRLMQRWEVARQLREMARSIREERLPEGPRAWLRQCREEEAAITREARRRLGVPEEERNP